MKKLLIIIILSFLLTNIGYTQDCVYFEFTEQWEVNNFPNRYPNCKNIEGSLVLRGENIVDLSPLSQIEIVGGLTIKETSLKTLNGLHNLQKIGRDLFIDSNNSLEHLDALSKVDSMGIRLIIFNNEVLNSIEGLDNMHIKRGSSLATNNYNYIIIEQNPLLDKCKAGAICEYLNGYRLNYIHNNGPNCDNRDKVFQNCRIPIDTDSRIDLFGDSFENWTNQSLESPEGWDSPVQIADSMGNRNIDKVEALVDGEFAVRLRSNVRHFEGYYETDLTRSLDTDLVDVSFTYKCLGEGYCNLNMREGGGTNLVRNIWNVVAGDPTQYSVLLQNIKPEFGTYFKNISFEAAPFSTGWGSFGISEFTIDDLRVTKKGVSSTAPSLAQKGIKLFPNPVSSQLSVETDHKFQTILIYDCLGRKLKSENFKNNINLDFLANGIYYLKFEAEGFTVTKKIVKI